MATGGMTRQVGVVAAPIARQPVRIVAGCEH
ncbi:hypothetical protein MycrhDRAFT_5595 [Mycolicibacterium rhodesiae JS60]|nr:hypothetical protein MycrhDRAFT_5595 [Mycolicibacterium rhodesiae JS60]